MEGYEKNRVKVTPEHVFYVIKFRKLANFGGQYLPFHCKGPHLREFRLKFDIKSFISKGQPWKILVATLEKLRQSDPRKRRFWTVFRKFSKIFQKFFWHQVDIFGVYKCHILEIFVQPLPWQLGPFEIPHTFFLAKFQTPQNPPGGGWGGRNILGGQQPHLYLSDDTCFVSIRNFATSAISTVTRAVTVKV